MCWGQVMCTGVLVYTEDRVVRFPGARILWRCRKSNWTSARGSTCSNLASPAPMPLPEHCDYMYSHAWFMQYWGWEPVSPAC